MRSERRSGYKAVYAYVPEIIKFLFERRSHLPNVPTYLMSDDSQRKYALENLEKLVGKRWGIRWLRNVDWTAEHSGQREGSRPEFWQSRGLHSAAHVVAVAAPCVIDGGWSRGTSTCGRTF